MQKYIRIRRCRLEDVANFKPGEHSGWILALMIDPIRKGWKS